MQLITHLAFDGHAEAAMTFYTKALAGQFEGPIHRNPDKPERIMHCQARFDSFTLMASDSDKDLTTSQKANVDLHLFFDNLDQAQQAFDAFAAVGQVDYPFEKQFWGAYFGRVLDPWGIPWSFSYQETQA